MKKQFAVVGNPIAHSRSPELHHAFAQACQLDLLYTRILAPLDGFADCVSSFFAEGGAGLNVTVPFKEQAFALCDVLSERAQIAQAVNTLYCRDGKLYGDNTDGQGLVSALALQNWSLKQANILILGAGGATRGVIYPLAVAGATTIHIANRTISKAQQLAHDLQPFLAHTRLFATGLDQLQGDFDIIINATSASLSGEPLFLPDTLHFRAAYEMAYGKTSSFILAAQQRHIPVCDGWSMLVGQAIEAFALWNGIRPDLKQFI